VEGPLRPGERRETPTEYLDRLRAERAQTARVERLIALLGVIPDEAADVRRDIARKLRAGQPLADYERELFADALAYRAENLRIIDGIVADRVREDALTEIFAGSAEIALAVVPVSKALRPIARIAEAGQAARRGESVAARQLTKREARKLAAAFLRTKAGKASSLAVRRSLRSELRTSGQRAASVRIREIARQRARATVAQRAASGVKATTERGAAKRIERALTRELARERAARLEANQAAARLRESLGSTPSAISNSDLLLKSPAALNAERAAIRAELGTAGSGAARALRARDIAIGTALQVGAYAGIQRFSQPSATPKSPAQPQATPRARPQIGVVPQPQATPSGQPSPASAPSPAATPQGQAQPFPAPFPSPSPEAEPQPSTGRPPGSTVKTGGGPGKPPPGSPPSKTPPPLPGGGGGGKPRRRFNPPGPVVESVTLRIPAGKNPSKIALRTGIVEREENLRTGRTRYARDLSDRVPNDPHIKPARSVRVTELTTAKVRFPQLRPFLRSKQIYIDRTGPNTVELAIIKRTRKGSKRPKLVRSRRDAK
jgi:hypothetical protein